MNILATIAQWERDVVNERTREARQFMKKSLRLVGAVPYGFDLSEGQLEPNVEEMKTVKRVLAMKRQGKSYQKIAARLNEERVIAKNGGKWHPKTVMGVLRHLQSLPGDHWVIKEVLWGRGGTVSGGRGENWCGARNRKERRNGLQG